MWALGFLALHSLPAHPRISPTPPIATTCEQRTRRQQDVAGHSLRVAAYDSPPDAGLEGEAEVGDREDRKENDERDPGGEGGRIVVEGVIPSGAVEKAERLDVGQQHIED